MAAEHYRLTEQTEVWVCSRGANVVQATRSQEDVLLYLRGHRLFPVIPGLLPTVPAEPTRTGTVCL